MFLRSSKTRGEGRRRGFISPSIKPWGLALVCMGLMALRASTPGASAAPTPCGGAGQAQTTLALDGVSLNLCQAFIAAPDFSAAEATDAIQMATAVDRSAGYREFSITAIPFGLRSPAESLPAAQAGGAETYRALLNDYRAQQGGQPQAGPTAHFFGQVITSTVTVITAYVDAVAPASVTVTEWVAEAGGRLWIIRTVEKLPAGGQLAGAETSPAGPGVGGAFELNSADLSAPSTSLAAAKALVSPPARALPSTANLTAAAAAPDLPAPPWWNGEACDYTHYTFPPPFNGSAQNTQHRPSYPLGPSYRGILACGPRPYYDSAPDVVVQFFTNAWGELEWECVELSMRFMRQAYGVKPYPGNGKDVVWNFTGTELVKVANGTQGEVPAPGDVLSYCNAGCTVGHTSVVAASNVNAAGNGTITIIEQNNSVSGTQTLTVADWRVKAGTSVTGWLHFPGNGGVSGVVKDASGKAVPGATVRLQKWMIDLTTATDGNGAYSFAEIPAGSVALTAAHADDCGAAEGTVTAGIVAHQTQPASDILLAPLHGSLSGLVRGPGGQPVAGANVVLQKCAVALTATTNSSGAYSFSAVPTGNVTLTATRLNGTASVTANVVRDQTQAAPDLVVSFDDAAYVADVSFPDQAVFPPGQLLTKTWRLRNTGTLTWSGQYQLSFIHGDAMGGAAAALPPTAPGQTADIAVVLTTPLSGGHFGYWRVQNPQGIFMGPTLFPQVNVQAPSPYLTLWADPPAPANTNQVRFYARAGAFPGWGALRLLIDGVVVSTTRSAELAYIWNTAGYAALGHSVVAEATDWTDTTWSRPERQGLVYTLQGTAGVANFAPDPPALVSPPDWQAVISTTQPLCAQGADANGDALQYQFAISSATMLTTSVWITPTCYTPGALPPNTYTWRAKSKDEHGLEGPWSEARHFSLASASGGLTRFDGEPLNAETVRIWACASLTAPVTLSVRVNTAADGSGRWDLLGERAGPCVMTDTMPVWNTLPYADGAHLLRVVVAQGVPSATVMLSDTAYTLAPRRPLTPTLVAPLARSGLLSDSVYLNSRTVAFRWVPAARALTQTLLVSLHASPVSDATPLVSQAFTGSVEAYTLTLDSDYPELYWQVLAANGAGVSVSGAQRLGVDRQSPTCTVQPPLVTGAGPTSMAWVGTNDAAGLASFNIYYRDTAEDMWYPWLLNLPAATLSRPFTGQAGHSYSFKCEALDRAGNLTRYLSVYLPIVGK